MKLKSLHPANRCRSLHLQYQNLQFELSKQIDRREEAELRIQKLNNDYMSASDSSARNRIAARQGLAVADLNQAKQLIRQLDQQLRDLENDYFISGCEDILGQI